MADHSAQAFDVIVAGAGISGVLAAVRLIQSFPQIRVLLLERSERPGGRLRSSHKVAGEWNSGVSAVSPELFDYIANCLRLDPECKDLSDLIPYRQEKLGLVLGSAFDTLAIGDVGKQAAVRAVGGNAAAKEWDKFQELCACSPEEAEFPFVKLWKHPKKNPMLPILAHLASLCGIPDLWSASLRSLQERLQYLSRGLFFGPWESALDTLLKQPIQEGRIQLLTGCLILDAARSENHWQVHTEKGDFHSSKLIVAQSPWQAIAWLERKACPVPVLNLALKAKPTSSVLLVEKLARPIENDLTDLTLISSEEVFVQHARDGTLCFQTVIDYELSLDAPSVVKAIKRLRRASKKLKKALPFITTEGEYLALRSVAWAQSSTSAESKYWEKFRDLDAIQREYLAFCGDAYGSSYNPDENLVRSLTAACEAIVEHSWHSPLPEGIPQSIPIASQEMENA